MSMSFTDLGRPVAVLLLVLLVAACAGTPSPPQGTGPDAGVAAADGTAAALLPALPPPPVKKGNESVFAEAVAALREGRLTHAEILLLELTSDQPELAGPWINLGQVYVAMDNPEEARRAFQQAIRANPRSCTAYNELGVLSRQNGDFSGAETHYRTCIEVAPQFKDAYLNLGILYELYLGRLPEALDLYQRYLALLGEPDRRVQGWVMDLQRRLGV